MTDDKIGEKLIYHLFSTLTKKLYLLNIKCPTFFLESASPFFFCVAGVLFPALALPLPGPGVLTPELSEVSSCLYNRFFPSYYKQLSAEIKVNNYKIKTSFIFVENLI